MKLNSIERMGLDGSDREILFQQVSFYPSSVAYHNEFVFWSEAYKKKVLRFHISTNASEVLS